MQKTRPIILVGGGTGGHIFPLVAIGEELKAKDVPFVFVGSVNSKEQEVVTKLGWTFIGIKAGKWRRYSNIKSWSENIRDIFFVVSGFFQCLGILLRTGAPVVMSKGGYVALPMIYASRLLGRRLVIHESDAVMGATNKLSAGFATKVFSAFDPAIFTTHDARYEQVGIPVRRSLRQAAKLKAPKKPRPILLILPASQGSKAINELVKATLNDLLKTADVIHLTGEADYAMFQNIKATLSKTDQAHYKPYNFIDRELPYYFQTADLLISRASATTTAEAALFGKAVYMIPLPTAAADHQLINARQLEKVGAAVVREQSSLSPEEFLSDVQGLLADTHKLSELGDALKQYFNEDDTLEKITTELMKYR